MTLLLAVVAGAGLGYVLERGDFCFHSTWRGLFSSPREYSLVQAYLLLLLISTPIVQLLVALDVIDPFVAPFAWQASLVGGVLFGVGMVIASTCISGMFYKLGRGMLGMLVALAAWFVGDVIAYRGPLSGLRNSLNESPITVTDDQGASQVATVTSLLGPFGILLLVAAGGLTGGYLLRGHRRSPGTAPRGTSWGWLPLGAVAAGVLSLAWLLVRWHGFDYTYGTSGVPTQVWARVADGQAASWWITLALVSLIPGAVIAARLTGTTWVRGEAPGRYVELGVGGLVMGVGAGIAGGCNLGHSMVGVPLLSLGSITATVAMIAGVFLAHHLRARLLSGSSAPGLTESV